MAGYMPNSKNTSGAEGAANALVSTITIQSSFSDHLRNPLVNPAPPAVENRRLQIYRELIYKNIENFMQSGFPIIRSLYGDDDWQGLIRSFIHIHSSQTPYFTELGREFISYLDTEHSARGCDQPFLLELARYEWAESALFLADAEIPPTYISHAGDTAIIEGVPHLSPLAWPMVFNYPVHKIGQHYQPHQPSADPVCLVVYRNRADQVRFLECNAVTGRMLEVLEQGAGTSGRDLLQTIAIELQHPEPAQVFDGGRVLLEQLHSLDIIYYLE
ncbi:putative DNA-binding domain-containing protein [Pseudomonadales bacterium]|nr:putative DNA-binding domain-containing protein [Pseudomonadales bacterium]